MMRPDGAQNAPDISLGAFLQNNYRLFAIMSVFGGVSALLLTVVDAELTDTSPLVQRIVHIGIVASLLLFALVALTINQQFVAMYGNLKIIFLHPDTWTKFIAGVFILLFNVLVFCAGAIMVYYGDAFWTVAGVLLFLFAIVATYRLMYHTMIYLKTWFLKRGRDVSWGTVESIATWLYMGVFVGALLMMAATTGTLFNPGAYLQDHPVSLGYVILIGCLIGVVLGMERTDEELDDALDDAEL